MVTNSDGLVVFDTRIRGKFEFDIYRDNSGANRFDVNACADTSSPAGTCGPYIAK